MVKYVMVVQSNAAPGRDDDYNTWYDTIHMQDICDLPGVKSGRRFEATPLAMGPAGQPYLSIFEIETDDPGAFMAEMGKRAADGTIRQSDALDPSSVALWIYQQHDIPT
jgi:hypothetical protein